PVVARRHEACSAVAAVAAAAVARGQAHEEAHQVVDAAADQGAGERPVGDAAAGDVARADHHVVPPHAGQHGGEVAGVVAEVGVHGHQVVVAGLQRVAHAGDDGRAQAELARPVYGVDVGVGGGELVGQLPGAVGRVIVEDEDVRRGDRLADLLHQ